jgi:hypothetical protein
MAAIVAHRLMVVFALITVRETGCSAAALGASIRGSAVLRLAPMIRAMAVTTTSAFVCCAFPRELFEICTIFPFSLFGLSP